MNRRNFLMGTLSATGTAMVATASALETTPTATAAATPSAGGQPFRLNYAPHFGLFEKSAGKDPVEQLKFMADQGFRAVEDNGMKKRTPEEQERIAKEMQRLGMTMGIFVAHADFNAKTFVHRKPEISQLLRSEMTSSIEVAKRLNAKWCTLVLDQFDPKMDRGYQTANAIENLRECAELCEAAGVIMVIEPLNPRDHPGMFCSTVEQIYEICRAVKSPSIKLLFDFYHQQISAGNLLPNLDACWSEVAYIQLGDNPGRKEPGTGEINYRSCFAHIHKKGFTGLLGMEHGKSRDSAEGEMALIAAYRQCDSF